jgi:hypothetical protein
MTTSKKKLSVVFCHGIWADGSCFSKVIPPLQAEGHEVGLGKLFWAMLSGEPFLRLWYYDASEFSLERKFPEEPAMPLARRILENSVVEYEEDCLRDASELLLRLDDLIDALRLGGQFLKDRVPFRCRVCGLGQCSPQLPSDASNMSAICDHCGSVVVFSNPRSRPAWQ